MYVWCFTISFVLAFQSCLSQRFQFWMIPHAKIYLSGLCLLFFNILLTYYVDISSSIELKLNNVFVYYEGCIFSIILRHIVIVYRLQPCFFLFIYILYIFFKKTLLFKMIWPLTVLAYLPKRRTEFSSISMIISAAITIYFVCLIAWLIISLLILINLSFRILCLLNLLILYAKLIIVNFANY